MPGDVGPGGTVCVTGATGFLGANLVPRLLDAGYDVRAFVRDRAKAEAVLGAGDVELVDHDLSRGGELPPNAFDGCTALVHGAAYFREAFAPGHHGPALRAVNVDGTLRVFGAAHANGVANVIYISTLGVLRRPAGADRFEEDAPYNDETGNEYFRSKVEAERALDVWEQEHPEVRLTRILPGGMWGPHDAGPTPFGAFVLQFLLGKIPAILPGNVPFVDVRDVAMGVVRALSPVPSRRFIFGGRQVSVAEVLRSLAAVSGTRAPRVLLPYPIAYAAASMNELVAALRRRPPDLSRSLVTALQEDFDASSERAVRELGVEFRPIADTLRDQVDWYRTHGMAPV